MNVPSDAEAKSSHDTGAASASLRQTQLQAADKRGISSSSIENGYYCGLDTERVLELTKAEAFHPPAAGADNKKGKEECAVAVGESEEPSDTKNVEAVSSVAVNKNVGETGQVRKEATVSPTEEDEEEGQEDIKVAVGQAPPPTLRRYNGRMSLPGAFSWAPAQFPTRRPRENLGEEVMGDVEEHQQQEQPQNISPAHTSLSGLAIADAIDPSERHAYLQHAEEWDSLEAGQGGARRSKAVLSKKQLLGYSMLLAMVVAIVLAVILGVMLPLMDSGRSGTVNLTKNSTSDLDMSIEDYVLSILPDSTVDVLMADNDTESPSWLSPQTLALQWLLQDPFLERYPDWRILQRFAMATMYHATRGTSWWNNEGWMSYNHECSWFSKNTFADGVQAMSIQRFSVNLDIAYPNPCEEEDMLELEWWNSSNTGNNSTGAVKHLWLFENNLQGTLPREIFELLPSLKTMSLYVNSLSGSTIPSQIGQLQNFQGLNVAKTGLGGRLPSEIGLLTSTNILALYNNQMVGAVPSEVGKLSELIAFGFDSNQFSSAIPSEVGMLSNVAVLSLFDNQISGSIPTEVGNCQKLQMMWLQRNSLEGTMPSQLGKLQSLMDLSLFQNSLTGTIRKLLFVLSVGSSIA